MTRSESNDNNNQSCHISNKAYIRSLPCKAAAEEKDKSNKRQKLRHDFVFPTLVLILGPVVSSLEGSYGALTPREVRMLILKSLASMEDSKATENCPIPEFTNCNNERDAFVVKFNNASSVAELYHTIPFVSCLVDSGPKFMLTAQIKSKKGRKRSLLATVCIDLSRITKKGASDANLFITELPRCSKTGESMMKMKREVVSSNEEDGKEDIEITLQLHSLHDGNSFDWGTYLVESISSVDSSSSINVNLLGHPIAASQEKDGVVVDVELELKPSTHPPEYEVGFISTYLSVEKHGICRYPFESFEHFCKYVNSLDRTESVN